MTHWKPTVLGVALLIGALAGCSQKCCLHDCDDFVRRAGLPADLACNPRVGEETALPPIPKPATVNDPERPPRYITLQECIASALEKGTVGNQSLRFLIQFRQPGQVLFQATEDLGQFNTAQLVGADSLRVFALQPALQQSDIETSLARWDTVFRTFTNFSTTDLPANQFGNQNGQFTQWGMSLEKGLPSGGVADITFGNTPPGDIANGNFQTRGSSFYSRFVNPALPSGYSPDLRFNISQPLLKGFGLDINALTPGANTPAAQLSPEISQAPGIVVARLRFDQSRAEFERVANYMVLNVEACYQQLYALYVNLYSIDQAMRLSYQAWRLSKARYEAGSIPITGFAQTRGQYEDFRAQRIVALSAVLEQERILRELIGQPPEDGTRLVPVDTPTLARTNPDWDAALRDAMNLRPELVIARADIRQRQFDLIRLKNGLLPTLNLDAGYAIHGFGERLDGDGSFANGLTNNAFHSLASSHFSDYNVGLTAAVPLGFRAQYASVRAANIRLAQAFYVLRDQEMKAQNNLVTSYRLIQSDYEALVARRASREAYADQVEARFKEYQAGKIAVDVLLEPVRQWSNALTQEYQAIANYNVDLVGLEFCKGTLLQYNNIQIAEGPLPKCVQVRAVEHERQRAHAIVCRERPWPTEHLVGEGSCAVPCANVAMPANPPTLPALFEGAGPLPKSLDDGLATKLAPPAPPLTGTPALMLNNPPPASLPPVMPAPLPTAPAPLTPANPAPALPKAASLAAPAIGPTSASAAGRTGFTQVPPPPASSPSVYHQIQLPTTPLDSPMTLPVLDEALRPPH